MDCRLWIRKQYLNFCDISYLSQKEMKNKNLNLKKFKNRRKNESMRKEKGGLKKRAKNIRGYQRSNSTLPRMQGG